MCDDHLPYQWGWRWREGEEGNWTQGVGVSDVKRLGEGPMVFRIFY